MSPVLKVSDDVLGSVQARLRRIEGQVKGLQRMLAEGRDCAEVIQQTAAVRSALDSVALELIAAGLEQCVRDEVRGKSRDRGALDRLQRAFLTLR
jgi:DNA-binding FrmR family transcriptional regulator